MVTAAGPDLDRAETVTLFNDLCVLAPAALVEAPVTWQRIDGHRVRGTYTNGTETITADLIFNADDLRMGDAWPVIYREPDADPLPYHGLQGERLAWVQWNDLFYFGNSLRWRRNYRGPSDLSEAGEALAQLTAVARYDHRRIGAMVSRYRIEYYAHTNDAEGPSDSSRYDVELLDVDYVECRGAEGNASCQRLAN